MVRASCFQSWLAWVKARPEPVKEAEAMLSFIRKRMVGLNVAEAPLYHGFVRRSLLSALGMSYGCLSEALRVCILFQRGGIIKGGGRAWPVKSKPRRGYQNRNLAPYNAMRAQNKLH